MKKLFVLLLATLIGPGRVFAQSPLTEQSRVVSNFIAATNGLAQTSAGQLTDAQFDSLLEPYLLPKTADEDSRKFRQRRSEVIRDFVKPLIETIGSGSGGRPSDGSFPPVILLPSERERYWSDKPNVVAWHLGYSAPPRAYPALISNWWLFQLRQTADGRWLIEKIARQIPTLRIGH